MWARKLHPLAKVDGDVGLVGGATGGQGKAEEEQVGQPLPSGRTSLPSCLIVNALLHPLLLSTPFQHSFWGGLTSQEVMMLVSHLCNQNLIILTVDRNLQSKINIRCGGAKMGTLEALEGKDRR